jgi:uncharacterized FAD-dependent dehydrogenase
MLRITELKLPLDHAADALRPALCQRLGIADGELLDFTIFKRSYDARKKSAITLIYTLDFKVADEAALLKKFADDRHVGPTPDTTYKFVTQAPADLPARPVVIGTGPCGLLAGADPGPDGLQADHPGARQGRARAHERHLGPVAQALNPESNVQFGEGGAGTFSDGKLYSQIKDPQHLGRKVLEEFVKAGAPEEILYVSKPHIGTFRLVKMVENMRAEIIALGGEIRFGSKVERPDHRRDHHGAGRRLAGGETIASRPRRAGCRPQRARHLPDACTNKAFTSRPSPSRSASASSTRSR